MARFLRRRNERAKAVGHVEAGFVLALDGLTHVSANFRATHPKTLCGRAVTDIVRGPREQWPSRCKPCKRIQKHGS